MAQIHILIHVHIHTYIYAYIYICMYKQTQIRMYEDGMRGLVRTQHVYTYIQGAPRLQRLSGDASRQICSCDLNVISRPLPSHHQLQRYRGKQIIKYNNIKLLAVSQSSPTAKVTEINTNYLISYINYPI